MKNQIIQKGFCVIDRGVFPHRNLGIFRKHKKDIKKVFVKKGFYEPEYVIVEVHAGSSPMPKIESFESFSKRINLTSSMKPLQKINIIGDAYFHIFQMQDGSQQERETTQAEYAQLGKPNPTNPTIAGGVWMGSQSRRKYDSESGRIEKGQYAVDGDELHTCVVDGQITVGKNLAELQQKILAIEDAISKNVKANLK